MNRRGFTLIEAIMVIVLIALLSIVLVPNVMVFINKNNKNSCEKLIDNIESAAKMYVNQNKYELGFSCSTPKYITLKTLVDNGNLTSPITNPVTKKEVSLVNNIVKVTFDCDTKEFSYKVTEINEKLIDNIESAAKMYVNQKELNFSCSTPKYITLKTLVDNGNLTSPITNLVTKEEVSLDNKVKVTFDCDTKEFSYEVTGIKEVTEINCE